MVLARWLIRFSILLPTVTMSSTLIISALILALSSFTVQAKMFKCIDDNGKVSYSESRCKDTNAKEEAIIFKASSAQTAKEADEVGLMPGVPMGPHHPDTKRNPTGIIGYGVNSDHPQLKGLVIGEKDFTGEGLQPSQNRGTIEALMTIRYALIIASKEAGSSSNKANLPLIVSAKVLGKKAASNQEIAERLVQAVQWLSAMDARFATINMPLPGGDNNYTALCHAMDSTDILYTIAVEDLRKGSIGYPSICKPKTMMVVGSGR